MAVDQNVVSTGGDTDRQWRTIGLSGTLTLGQIIDRTEPIAQNSWLVIAGAEGSRRWSHPEFMIVARKVAGGLARLGIGRQDVVAVQLPASIEALLAHAACALLGATLLPIVHIYGSHEMRFILAESNARLLITPAQGREGDMRAVVGAMTDLPYLAHHVVVGSGDRGSNWADLASGAPISDVPAADPGDIAVLLYTSGTTAMPKGVQHSHASIAAELSLGIGEFVGPSDPMLCLWPPGHIAGYLMGARFWALGFRTVMLDRWDAPVAARLIAEHRVAMSQGTAFHISSLLDAAERDGHDLSSIREFMAGAAVIPPTLVQRCDRAGVTAVRAYGMTEFPTATRGSRDDPPDRRVNTDGRPCPGIEVRIVDDRDRDLPTGQAGEVLLRGPKRFVGYRRPELDAETFVADGWMRTGDIGTLDELGYLTIVDRKKDIIIRGGENISAREVEQLASEIPAIEEAAALGAADDRMGEVVALFARTRTGAALSLSDVQDHFRAIGAARQKTPELLIVVQDFPRTPLGKIKKQELRRLWNEGQLAPIATLQGRP